MRSSFLPFHKERMCHGLAFQACCTNFTTLHLYYTLVCKKDQKEFYRAPPKWKCIDSIRWNTLCKTQLQSKIKRQYNSSSYWLRKNRPRWLSNGFSEGDQVSEGAHTLLLLWAPKESTGQGGGVLSSTTVGQEASSPSELCGTFLSQPPSSWLESTLCLNFWGSHLLQPWSLIVKTEPACQDGSACPSHCQRFEVCCSLRIPSPRWDSFSWMKCRLEPRTTLC